MFEVKDPAKTGHEYGLITRRNMLQEGVEIDGKTHRFKKDPGKFRVFSLPKLTYKNAHLKIRSIKTKVEVGDVVLLNFKEADKTQSDWRVKLVRGGLRVDVSATETIRGMASDWGGVFVCRAIAL